ncbi:DDE_superfamily endonuclease domain containing protein [Hexamita inflata]|uniref:DDE_superfamily endonuclease domain containing protein n=1 Tax=Hexamita inflata TaxID=28002 RepID=A0ABP1LA12_9EUKA
MYMQKLRLKIKSLYLCQLYHIQLILRFISFSLHPSNDEAHTKTDHNTRASHNDENVRNRIANCCNQEIHCLLPSLQSPNCLFHFQDNAPTHFSKYMKNFYTANNIELYRFPVMSPDLNPLFHCWNQLKSNIFPEGCTTYDLFKEEVKRAWEQIPQDIINHLIDSMPKRLEEVLKQIGDATKY